MDGEEVLSEKITLTGNHDYWHPAGTFNTCYGKTLAESGIGAQTGLNVVAVKTDGRLTTRLAPDLVLEPGTELVMIGSDDQLNVFVNNYD